MSIKDRTINIRTPLPMSRSVDAEHGSRGNQSERLSRRNHALANLATVFSGVGNDELSDYEDVFSAHEGSSQDSSLESSSIAFPERRANSSSPDQEGSTVSSMDSENIQSSSLADVDAIFDPIADVDAIFNPVLVEINAEINSMIGVSREGDTVSSIVPRDSQSHSFADIDSIITSTRENLDFVINSIRSVPQDDGSISLSPSAALGAAVHVPQDDGSLDSIAISSISDQSRSAPTGRETVREQMKLSGFEKGAICRTIKREASEFLLKQKNTELAEFTKELGRVSEDFLECREAFLNANLGAWREHESNDDTLMKISDLVASCSRLNGKFIEAKAALEPNSDASPSPVENEAMVQSLSKLEEQVNDLYLKTADRMSDRLEEEEGSTPQDYWARYAPQNTYSLVMTERENEVAKSYLQRSHANSVTEIDARLMEAEESQKRRDIHAEYTDAVAAYYQLSALIANLKSSPKYQLFSITRKLLRKNEKFGMQKVVEHLKDQALLVARRINTLQPRIMSTYRDLSLLKRDCAGDMSKSLEKYDKELKTCLNMRSRNLSEQERRDLDDRVEHLNRAIQGRLNRYGEAMSRLSESRSVIENTPWLDAGNTHDVDAAYERFCSAFLEARPAFEIMSGAVKILDDVAKQIDGFNELGFPSKSEGLRSILAKPLEDKTYVALEKLNSLRTACEERNFKDAYLDRVFQILDYPEVQSAMQTYRLEWSSSLWPIVASTALEAKTENGFAMTEEENSTARSCLNRLENEIRTNDKAAQQNTVKQLQDILRLVESRIDTDTYAPFLKDYMDAVSAKLKLLDASMVRSIQYEEAMPSDGQLLNNCISGCDDFIAKAHVFEVGLRPDVAGTETGERPNNPEEGAMTRAMQGLRNRLNADGVWTYKQAIESMVYNRNLLKGIEGSLSTARTEPSSSGADNEMRLSDLKSILDRVEGDLLFKVLRAELAAVPPDNGISSSGSAPSLAAGTPSGLFRSNSAPSLPSSN